MGEPFSWRWFLPLPLPKHSPSYYVYKPTDDPDAYEPRDPVIQRHFRKIEEAHRLQQQKLQQQQQWAQEEVEGGGNTEQPGDGRRAPAGGATALCTCVCVCVRHTHVL
jgi:hypothetical protein